MLLTKAFIFFNQNFLIMKKIKKEKKPFFSKFLEVQKLDDPKQLKGGKKRDEVTMKWPSDGDEI